MKSKNTLGQRLNHYYARFLQELAYRTGGSFGRPTDAIILLTNRCNARCLHCHSWKLPHLEEMTTEQWKGAFRELRKWLGPIFISMTGGETLLRNDAIDLAHYAADLGFWVEYLTNGYLVDVTKAKRLVQSGVRRVRISLDGSRPEIHDKVRGREGFFRNATDALRSMAEEKRESGRTVQVLCRTTIMSLNVEDLPNIAILARDLGIDGVEFQALEPVYYSDLVGDLNWYKDNPLWITDLDRLSHGITRLKELKTQGYPILNSFENLDLMQNYFSVPEELAFKIHSHEYKKKKRECRSWLGGLQIVPDGGMKMCHWMKPFANAKDGHIQKAWRNRFQCWKSRCAYIT